MLTGCYSTVFLDLHYLHTAAASLRYGKGVLFSSAGLTRHPLFDLSGVVTQASAKALSLEPARLYAPRKLLDLYLPCLGYCLVEPVEVHAGFGDQAAVEVALAYDVAATVTPYAVISRATLGVRRGSFRHLAAALDKAQSPVTFVDLTSKPVLGFEKVGDTHLIPEWVWRHPTDLPEEQALLFNTLEDGAFVPTLLTK